MDLRLLEEWLISFIPARFHTQLHPIMVSMRENPYHQFLGSMHLFQKAFAEDADLEMSGAFINGLLLGVCICEAYGKGPRMRAGILEAIEHNRKVRGENVVNFSMEKARKK